MSNSVSLQPMLTSNAAGGFSTQSEGYVQGVALDDPAIRNALSMGPLLATETLPMWGGVALAEYLAAGQGNALGNSIARATLVANITGFSVFNQASAWINTPQSQVPTAGAGQSIPFYRLGSGARIAIACEPTLGSLNSGLITQQVSWDFNNQRLQAYNAATATVSLTSITASYSATTGLWTFVVVAAAASDVVGVGDAINVSGVSSTGGTAVLGTLNTNQIVTAFTDNQHFSFQIAAGAASYGAGALAGTLVLNQGVGALNVKVLSVDVGNSKIVSYDAVNNLANWNNTGSTAVILI